MRSLFETSNDLMNYIHSNFMSEKKVKENIEFDYKTQILNKKTEFVIEKMYQSDEKVNGIIKMLTNKNVYLWGAGYYGKLMRELLLKYNIVIKAFIDNNGDKVDGKTIVSPKQVEKGDKVIIISIADTCISNEIKKQIVNENIDCQVMTFDDLFYKIENC